MVNNNFMYPTKFSEIFRFPKNLLIRQAGGKSDDKNEIPLNDPNIGKVFPIFRDLLLLCLKKLSTYCTIRSIREPRRNLENLTSHLSFFSIILSTKVEFFILQPKRSRFFGFIAESKISYSF
jgi:hypothetical protein